jgi:hypothetical protein
MFYTFLWKCESVWIYKIDSDICKVKCSICFYERVVNVLYKMNSRCSIKENISFEQRKVGPLRQQSTMEAESFSSIGNNER